MESMHPFLLLAHVFGLALGAGPATAKTVLLFRCRSDPGFLPIYLAVNKILTRLILAGLALLVASGVLALLFYVITALWLLR